MCNSLPIVYKDFLPTCDCPRRPQAAGEVEPGAGHEVEGDVGVVELVVRLQRRSFLRLCIVVELQGDTSGCAKPPVDFKTKVLLWPG